MKLRDGSPLFDCLAILDVLHAPIAPDRPTLERASRWNLLWNDLQTRALQLEPDERNRVLRAALESLLPDDARSRPSTSLARSGATFSQQPTDVIIFCIIEEEFNAILAAFGVDRDKLGSRSYFFGHRFHRVALKTRNCGMLSVWIALVGEARNVVCAQFCRDVFERFQITTCCILVGIAAGNREKLRYGDVATAHTVFDVEGERVEPTIKKPRLRPYPLIPQTWRQVLTTFNPDRYEWLKEREAGLAKLKKSGAKLPKIALKRLPRLKTGIIVSGEKLRRDDPLPGLAARFGDELIALEMEGSGFASSCDRKGIKWLVFRGISDYGNMRKRDDWQSIAAFHAAIAAKTFLQHHLPSKDTTFSNQVPGADIAF